MIRRLLGSIFVLFSLNVVSQSYSINGRVIDEQQEGLSSATVYLEAVSDSTLLDYSITNFDGEFSLSIRSEAKRVNLFVSFQGYKKLQKIIFLKNSNINLGILELNPDIASLEEVKIEGRSAPVSMKGDTLEFNASSFKTRNDANLQDLLKQLPGVEVDGAELTVNGKRVNKILVNGTEFFENDLKIATKNLPRSIIDKVQVVDAKSDLEEFTGKQASTDDKNLNIKLKEDSNNGFNGRAIAGYGTNDRYQLNAIVNLFKDKERLSMLVGANTINNPGFSFDEVYDMIGNQQSLNRGDDNDFELDNISFGSAEGITESANTGASYTNSYDSGSELSANYFYGGSITQNQKRSFQENFLADDYYHSASFSDMENANDSHRFSGKYHFNVDSTTLVSFQPKIAYTKSHSWISSTEKLYNANNELTSQSEFNQYNFGENTNFEGQLEIIKNLNSYGSYFSFLLSYHQEEESIDSNYSSYVQSNDQDPSNIDQYRDSDANMKNLYLRGDYRMILAEGIYLDYRLGYSNHTNENAIFVYDNLEPEDTHLEELSSDFDYEFVQFLPELNFSLERDNLNLSIGTRYNGLQMDKSDGIRGYSEESEDRFFTLQGNLKYKFNNFTRAYISYQTENRFPELDQLQPINDLRNPLKIFRGNPNLRPELNHSFRLNFTQFNFKSKTNIILFAQGGFTKHQIVSDLHIQDNLVSQTSYLNTDNNYSLVGGVGFIKELITNGASKLKLDTGIASVASKNTWFINDFGLETQTQSYMPRIGFEYRFKNMLEFEPAYRVSFTKNSYNTKQYADNSFVLHRLDLKMTTYFPSWLTWGNDLSYNYNGSISHGLGNSSLIWNMSMGVNVFKEKATLKVTTFDLLNQYVNTKRIVSGNYIQDIEHTVLTQYVMLSFSYNFNTMKGE